jgi:polysaccharide biosynthesis/export protein
MLKNRKFLIMLFMAGLAGCGVLQPSGYASMDPGYDSRELPSRSFSESEPVLAVVRITKHLTASMKKIVDQQEQQFVNAALQLAQEEKRRDYMIGVGDSLSISLRVEQDIDTTRGQLNSASSGGRELERQYTVQANGSIILPMLGRVSVAKMSELDAAQMMENLYKRFYKNPEVDLRVLNHRSNKVIISGDFKKTGLQNLSDSNVSLLDIVSKTDGYSIQGDRYTVSLRRDAKSYAFDLNVLAKKGFNIDNIILKNGDVISASKSDSRVGVMGETLTTRMIQIKENGLTLNEALLEVGGVNPTTSNVKQIYVIRQNNTADPSVFLLSAKSALDLAVAENFYLQGRDIVYVDAVPLARWNRILSLVLPGAASVPAVRAITQ